ncbi:MAG TPA: amidohydrolase family protein [Microthrixaceae bacterium]|mgnify:FL=1|nr:amidohydrolase family protein [Microthrixaceae bacterium]
MAIPDGIGTIDTMIGFPHGDMKAVYEFITRQTRDRESKEEFEFPAEYMFKQVPEKEFVDADDPVAVTVDAMDRVGIAQGMIGVDEISQEAMRRFPGRFFASAECDPHAGVEGLRRLRRLKDEFDIKAVGCFPAGTFPQVPINDKLMYPIYATCCELDIPIFCCAGVPGPRLKMNPQRVELIDEVMYDFPELVFVTRHGCEPWADLAVKLMIKWPNLYYSTSAFAPKYYPKAIIDYANTRGAHKVIYAGYFPMGLSLDRIHSEMPNVPFKEEVWPGFLRDNAARILRL